MINTLNTLSEYPVNRVHSVQQNNEHNDFYNFDYIQFIDGTNLHYQTVISLLRQKNLIYTSFNQNYTSDTRNNMSDSDSVKLTQIFSNINFIGLTCGMLADNIAENNGDHECEPNAFYEVLFTTFNSSMSLHDLLEMTNRQVQLSPELF